MAALHLPVVPRRIRPYQLVPYTQPRRLRFKQRRQFPPAVGKPVREFKAIVRLYAFYRYPFAFERCYHFPQKAGGGICALLLVCPPSTRYLEYSSIAVY